MTQRPFGWVKSSKSDIGKSAATFNLTSVINSFFIIIITAEIVTLTSKKSRFYVCASYLIAEAGLGLGIGTPLQTPRHPTNACMHTRRIF